MRTFKNFAAQGEAFFRRVDAKPDDGVEVEPVDGKHIIAHSETGHHHLMDASGVTVLERTENVPEGMKILHLIVDEPTALEHLRATDTHEPIMFEKGHYEVRLQREYTPEGLRRVQD